MNDMEKLIAARTTQADQLNAMCLERWHLCGGCEHGPEVFAAYIEKMRQEDDPFLKMISLFACTKMVEMHIATGTRLNDGEVVNGWTK